LLLLLSIDEWQLIDYETADDLALLDAACPHTTSLANQTDVDSITGTETAGVLEFAYFVAALLLTDHGRATDKPYCRQ